MTNFYFSSWLGKMDDMEDLAFGNSPVLELYETENAFDYQLNENANKKLKTKKRKKAKNRNKNLHRGEDEISGLVKTGSFFPYLFS